MSEINDADLLRQFIGNRSDAAFTELTRRHLNLVYSAALRQVDGDRHTAEDVVQMVFAELVRQANRLENHPTLTGWLYMTTRQMAGHVRRGSQRRERREQEAYAMQNQNRENETEDWRQLRQVLDESMHELPEPDRLALLVRFFEGRELRRVGEVLGLSENSARMRVQRALEKLRDILTRKGVTATTSGLATLLAANSVTAAPAALLASAVAASALGAGGAAKLGGLTVAKTILLTMKTPLSYISVLILASAPLLIQQLQTRNARAELTGLRNELAALSGVRARAANAAARQSDAEELAALRRDEDEIRKLRREAGTLQALSDGSRKAALAKAQKDLRTAQAARDAETEETDAVELREKTVSTMKHMSLASRVYANDHKDQFPRTFEDMKEELQITPETAIFLERFEFYPQPRQITFNEPQLFLFREKEPRKIPGGKWERTYTLAEGSVQNATSDSPDFTEWEKKSFGIASAEAPGTSTSK